MRRNIPLLLALLLLAATPVSGERITFHVSPAGNDSWSGRRPEPNRAGDDGPFRTFERARNAVRTLKALRKYPRRGGAAIFIRGGTYRIMDTLRLAAEDSGTKDSPVVWRAAPGEKVRFTGGVTVTGFLPATDLSVLARLDPAARGKVLQADLRALGVADYGEVNPEHGKRLEVYFRGKFMTLARWPNEGWLTIADVPQTGPKRLNEGLDRDTSPVPRGRHYGRFTYEGDRPSRWAPSDDIWAHGYWTWDWSDQHLRVARLDTLKHEIYPAEPHHGYGYTKGQRFYFLNILEELDAPGEWYLDRMSGVLYIWPPEAPHEGDVTVSVLDAPMITLDGASHIIVRGIAFEDSRGAAVTVRGGSDVMIAGCAFRNFGLAVVTIEGGERNGVRSCDIHDTAAGGIILHGGDRKTLAPAGNYAENNHIHDYAVRLKTYQVAVEVTGVGNRVAHNLIHDAPHIGIFLSTSALGNEHLIEFNELHSLAKETGDVGAIYLCARDYTMRGTVIRHNYVHDLLGPGLYGVMGVYLDDFTSGTTVYGNVFFRAGRASFIGGGRNNTIENNVYVECAPSVHLDARGLGWAKGWFESSGYRKLMENMNYRNPPYSTRYPELLTLLDDEPAEPKHNRIIRNVSFGGKWFDLYDGLDFSLFTMEGNLITDAELCWRRKTPGGEYFLTKAGDPEMTALLEGKGNRLMTGDPGFVDVKNCNFRMKRSSLAWKLGFRRIPIEKIGLYDDEYRRGLPEE